ncbi:MAG TPA: hypothetical protein VH637_26260 [Streptosporangiaceae bacterium]|jgi:hypothetical protein
MEPLSGQRKAAFALVVIVLAGLGGYLLVPALFGSHQQAAPVAASSPDGTPASQPASAPAPPTSPAPDPATTSGPAQSRDPDIYQWLPFGRSDLGAAAGVVAKFGADYGTFSYTESSGSYVGAMRNLITPGLSQQLARAYGAPGVAGPRVTGKQVGTGRATISSLRAFGGSSITFVVTISQQITGAQGKSSVTGRYSVTATGSGQDWQVSDIELASAGNT